MKNVKSQLQSLLHSRVKLLLAVLAFEIILFSCLSQYFFTLDNLLGSTQFGAILALVSIGQTIIWLAGGEGIDLSVGAILSLAGVILGKSYQAGLPFWFCIILTILLGLGAGMVNGYLCAFIGFPPLIATLGTSFIFSSLALFITDGRPISGFPEEFGILSLESTFNIPNQVLFVVLPIFLIAYFVLYRTRAGRKLYLVGTNDVSARFSTISASKVRFAAYSISGILSGIGAVIMCAWLMTAKANAGDGLDLQSVTVTALGGIGVMGGQGNLAGTLLGVLIITFMNSGLDLCQINSIWKLAIQGVILIAAVALNQTAKSTKK